MRDREGAPRLRPRARRASIRLLYVSLCLLPTLAGCRAEHTREQAPSNVVLIALDTVRPDRLGHYGHREDTSPRLDRLAGQSVVFEDAQAPSPWTAPSLVSLLTGLYPEAHGLFRFPNPGRLSPKVETLTEMLREQGYRTAAFTEGGYAKAAFGLGAGFEQYPTHPGDAHSHGSNVLHPSRIAANVDRAIGWLDGLGDEPFFLFFHTYEAHYPYRAPEETIRRFWPGYSGEIERAALERIAKQWNRDRRLSLPAWDRLVVHAFHCRLRELPGTQEQKRLHDLVQARIHAFERGKIELGDGTLERLAALYDAELRFTDAELGRLLERLEPLREHTILTVVSDHGEGLGQHRRIQHGKNLHDELTRAVLLMRIPGRRPARVPALVRTVDWMPTLLELLGLPLAPQPGGGRSLLPLLDGRDEPRFAYASAIATGGEELRMRALRSERFTYLHDRKTGLARLFDRDADPGELRDVAARHPGEVARHRSALEALASGFEDLAHDKRAEDTELSEDTRAELEALGYLE